MKKLVSILSLLLLSLLISHCSNQDNNPDTNEDAVDLTDDDMVIVTPPPMVNPLFTNSIVSTNIDFITATDPDAFMNIQYIGQDNKEMPDSRNNNLFDTGTYVFEVNFTTGPSVEIWAHSSFGSVIAAQEYADKLTSRLGKLPGFMRNQLSHVVLHNGDAGAFAESEGNFFIIYSVNMDTRISNNDLEETVFHESVHATLDADYLQTAPWLQAQQNDNTFITQYARENADKEDMAESAIFAYTMIKYPGRLSTTTESWVTTNIPNRYAFFQTIFN